MPTTSAPATAYSLEALADLFTRAFEGYVYAGVTTAQSLSRRVAVEQIDLFRSPVLLVDGEPAGLALVARRGERVWCGGFGITRPHRGRGLAHTLATMMIEQAQEGGARRLMLEVLTRNVSALRVYQRAGMVIQRRLLVLSWRPGESGPPEPAALEEADPAELVLGHFAGLHPLPAAWQREPPALLALPDLRGLALRESGATLAYALVQGDAASMRIADLGARDGAAAARLISGLQGRAVSLISINEPEGSPISAAYQRAGFTVADEQFELLRSF